MEYVSLEDRIMAECKDRTKEYLVKKSVNGLLGLFYVIYKVCSNEMKDYLLTGKKNDLLDPLLCVLPLVLKNGKSFDTEKVIASIQKICPDITASTLFDCLALFSYTFDLLYGASVEDTLENLNLLSHECVDKLKVMPFPKLTESTILSVTSSYKSLKALQDYVLILQQKNMFDYKYSSNTSKAIVFFLNGIVTEKSCYAYQKIEKEFAGVIKVFLKLEGESL